MTQFEKPQISNFVVWDYLVFAALLVVSAGIGVFFAIKDRKKKTSGEFLVGGRQMTFGPVALSLTASFMSAVTVLGVPSDIVRFGAHYIFYPISYTLVIIITSELYLPVFYRSGITSTYEYLELRFNKVVRYASTCIYIIQTILYTGIVVYTPALALNQVTGFDLWGAVSATGIVCTFYCTLGGLKAVVWTDAFQAIVIIVGFLSVLIEGTIIGGGPTKIWNTGMNGSRLDVADFNPDPLLRHTFWTVTVGGTCSWLGIYGVNQSTMQRCISCKSERHAKIALYLNMVGLWMIMICAVFSGLVMYAYYEGCNPWAAGFIQAPDQMLPYFVMEIFSKMPGMPGIFVACAFSGTLSTVAASINALATVTFEDFVKNIFKDLSPSKGTWISKGLCLLFGALCTAMAVVASYLGPVQQGALGGMIAGLTVFLWVANGEFVYPSSIVDAWSRLPAEAAGSILGMCGGPILAVFTMGIVLPWTNWKGALGGMITGLTISFWVAIGGFVYPSPPSKTRPLTLRTDECILLNETFNSTAFPTMTTDWVTTEAPDRGVLAETWYCLSYQYYGTVGFLCCFIAGTLISFITGRQRAKDVDPLLIRPVCNLLCFWSEKYKKKCWCGVDHEKVEELDHNGLSKDIKLTPAENAPENDSSQNPPGYNVEEKSYTNINEEKLSRL